MSSQPGDVVIVNQACYHAVFGHALDRCMLQLSWSAWPRTAAQLAALHRDFPLTFEPHESLLLEGDASELRTNVHALAGLKDRARSEHDRLLLLGAEAETVHTSAAHSRLARLCEHTSTAHSPEAGD